MAIVHNEYTLAQAIIYAMVKRKDEHPYSGLDIQNNLRQVSRKLCNRCGNKFVR